MKQNYIDDNLEFINEIITEMTKIFKVNKLIRKPAAIQSDQMVVTKSKQKLYRYGFNFSQEGENQIYLNIQKIKNRIVAKYDINKYDAELEANHIMCLYVLKHVFANIGEPFTSNYEKYSSKREVYTLLKGVTLLALILALLLFFLIRGF